MQGSVDQEGLTTHKAPSHLGSIDPHSFSMVGVGWTHSPHLMEKDSEAWGGGQSLRPSETYGEGAKEITIRERERLGKQQKDWGLRDQLKGRQRGPGRAKWHPCRGERDKERGQ